MRPCRRNSATTSNMALDLAVTIGMNAISAILILAMIALGLWIILGMMGVINLAHGAFLAVGAYTVWFVQAEVGLGFWAGLIAAPFVVGFMGLALEYLVVRHLYDRLVDTLLATWGIAIVIEELIKLSVGDDAKPIKNPLPGQTDILITQFPTYRLFLMGLCVAVLGSMWALFRYTNFGIRLRAVFQDDESAALLGINREKTYRLSFILGAGVAGIAGAALTPLVSVQPTLGTTYLIKSFLTIILGGAASPLGVLPGAGFIAGTENVGSFYVEPIIAQTGVLALVIAIIIARPPVKRVIKRRREQL